jgi:hypothetical protein
MERAASQSTATSSLVSKYIGGRGDLSNVWNVLLNTIKHNGRVCSCRAGEGGAGESADGEEGAGDQENKRGAGAKELSSHDFAGCREHEGREGQGTGEQGKGEQFSLIARQHEQGSTSARAQGNRSPRS